MPVQVAAPFVQYLFASCGVPKLANPEFMDSFAPVSTNALGECLDGLKVLMETTPQQPDGFIAALGRIDHQLWRVDATRGHILKAVNLGDDLPAIARRIQRDPSVIPEAQKNVTGYVREPLCSALRDLAQGVDNGHFGVPIARPDGSPLVHPGFNSSTLTYLCKGNVIDPDAVRGLGLALERNLLINASDLLAMSSATPAVGYDLLVAGASALVGAYLASLSLTTNISALNGSLLGCLGGICLFWAYQDAREALNFLWQSRNGRRAMELPLWKIQDRLLMLAKDQTELGR